MAKIFVATHLSMGGKHTILYSGTDAMAAEKAYKGSAEPGKAWFFSNPMPSRSRRIPVPRPPEPSGEPPKPPAEPPEEPHARSHHKK